MDYYLEDKSRLKGQPKRTIGDYVESKGFLVPRRFDTLNEARKSGKKIFLRSEHAQEYDGASGMLDSFDMPEGKEGKKFQNLVQIKNAHVSSRWDAKIPVYCYFHSLEEKELTKEISFSAWEKIPGLNQTVIADSAIPDRHHILTEGYNYIIFDNGKLIEKFRRSVHPSNIDNFSKIEQSLEKTIDIYERIRSLENFDSSHCPIMEFQNHNSQIYFLQYHRTRDFEPSSIYFR